MLFSPTDILKPVKRERTHARCQLRFEYENLRVLFTSPRASTFSSYQKRRRRGSRRRLAAPQGASWIAAPSKLCHNRPAQAPAAGSTQAFRVELRASSVGGAAKLQAIILPSARSQPEENGNCGEQPAEGLSQPRARNTRC